MIHQQLDRAILSLVVHFSAVFDPVAQIHCLQAEAHGFANLPENGIAAEAASLFTWIVEGIDGRQAIGECVGHGDSQQAARQAELVEAGKRQERWREVASGDFS